MEAAAAAAGFMSLTFNVFSSCVQAFDFFYTAQHIGADGDLFASKLQWEQYRLVEWGGKAGLRQDASQNNQLNWQLACALLQQLESFLTSAERLKVKYRLDVVEEEVDRREQTAITNSHLTGIGKFIARLKPEIYTARGQIVQANNSTMKRLRWAATGKEQANAIIREISDLNSKLHQLLDSIEQEKRAKVDEILLRDILSRSSTASEVEQIQQILEPAKTSSNESIKAAAALKQIRLVIGADKREDEIKTTPTKQTQQSMPSITKFKHKKLTPYTTGVPLEYKGIEFACYSQKPVLVEWKFAEGPMWKQLQDQVRFLAVMLASPAGKASQSLLCIGYLPWEERDLYGLVYEIPGTHMEGATEHWKIKTLHDLILEQPFLSLARRFTIATQMAEVILQLHTAGWLHKSLRSENIVFVAPRDSSPSEFLDRPPYLVGYEYARPDSAQAAQLTQLPNTALITDLYRHPQARGITREKYRKQFDMYALGCVLLEIGLWQRLLDIKTAYVNPNLSEMIDEATKANLDVELPSLLEFESQGECADKLRHCTGEALTEAINLCMSTDSADNDGIDVSLNIQQAVVKRLRECTF